ncbi:hypothetical protein L2Y96_03395 [Luteibacter aegosomaticola]|uniref:hypothetical protein n=1 Tax=Luteibacter aegosomaticola TaxID=2911538 RepID=UPI001FFBB66F|nr:hypothetical protein [Luteibacter aegosomaticola]UPG90832.1 hypothetical protein L2Y96_03395 [Luteibacter aegosomaticola]
MEKRRMALRGLQALTYLLMPTIGLAASAPAKAPHPDWNGVLRLLGSPSGPIEAGTVERALGVTMTRKGGSADDYHAWIEGQEGDKGPSSVQLTYTPSLRKGQAGRHESTLQIFVRDIECVAPERMRADLLHAGFVATSPRTSTTTLEFYRLGDHRALRVTYPPGRTGAARQLWALRHHTADEDTRCVGDVLVTETG